MPFTDTAYQQYYPGWDRASAQADWNAVGQFKYGGSTSGGTTVDSILNAVINPIVAKFNKIKPYDEVNPFSFDEQLAKDAATAEYTPYYDQLLSDYTQSVETTKSRSSEDLNDTLKQLAAGKEYYMGTERKLLDRAIDNANKGWAGNGLFFSGAREKDINEINQDYGDTTGEYLRQYSYNTGQAKKGNTRTQEDVATSLGQYTRNIGQEKKGAIAGGVLQRQSEAVQQYEMGRQQYYDNAMYS